MVWELGFGCCSKLKCLKEIGYRENRHQFYDIFKMRRKFTANQIKQHSRTSLLFNHIMHHQFSKNYKKKWSHAQIWGHQCTHKHIWERQRQNLWLNLASHCSQNGLHIQNLKGKLPHCWKLIRHGDISIHRTINKQNERQKWKIDRTKPSKIKLMDTHSKNHLSKKNWYVNLYHQKVFPHCNPNMSKCKRYLIKMHVDHSKYKLSTDML